MPYWMRWFSQGEIAPSLEDIGGVLPAGGPSLDEDVLTLGGQEYAQLFLDVRGSETCDEEIQEFLEFLEDVEESPAKQRVVEGLGACRWVVGVQVLWGDREAEETLQQVDVLWPALASFGPGLLQADGEGFYADGELLVELE